MSSKTKLGIAGLAVVAASIIGTVLFICALGLDFHLVGWR